MLLIDKSFLFFAYVLRKLYAHDEINNTSPIYGFIRLIAAAQLCVVLYI